MSVPFPEWAEGVDFEAIADQWVLAAQQDDYSEFYREIMGDVWYGEPFEETKGHWRFENGWGLFDIEGTS